VEACHEGKCLAGFALIGGLCVPQSTHIVVDFEASPLSAKVVHSKWQLGDLTSCLSGIVKDVPGMGGSTLRAFAVEELTPVSASSRSMDTTFHGMDTQVQKTPHARNTQYERAKLRAAITVPREGEEAALLEALRGFEVAPADEGCPPITNILHAEVRCIEGYGPSADGTCVQKAPPLRSQRAHGAPLVAWASGVLLLVLVGALVDMLLERRRSCSARESSDFGGRVRQRLPIPSPAHLSAMGMGHVTVQSSSSSGIQMMRLGGGRPAH